MVRNRRTPAAPRKRPRVSLTPLLKPVWNGTICFSPASARRSGESLPFTRTIRSSAVEGTIFQVVPPALTAVDRSAAVRVTVVFLPAIVHWPAAWVTVTGGAPQSPAVKTGAGGAATTGLGA